MKTMSAGLVASALAVSLLFLPSGLTAQEKRGAEIIVTKLDGNQIRGELIAVKPDSLLLLGPAGNDLTVDTKDLGTVRIVRTSPNGLLTLAGFLLGSGAVGMTTEPLDEWGWAHAGLAGVGGAIAGLISGVVSAKDKTIYSWGAPDSRLSQNLDKLGRLSREGRSSVKPGPSRRPRFRLGLATTMGTSDTSWRSRITEAAWHFTESVPPGEDIPYVTDFILNQSRSQELASFGPISLGCEWTERWISEIELSLFGKDVEANMSAYPNFVSVSDGKLYQAYIGDRRQIEYRYALVGAAFRPVIPAGSRKTSVEIGLAVGPAWVRAHPGAVLPGGRKTFPIAQVRAAYDHYFTPAFFLGVYGAYRYGEARFPEATVTREMTFRDSENWQDPAEPITRQIELIVPAWEFSRSGLIYGLRIGFRI